MTCFLVCYVKPRFMRIYTKPKKFNFLLHYFQPYDKIVMFEAIFYQKRGVSMAKCAICEKGNMYGHHLSYSRSHVSRRANRVWKSNVKSVKVMTENGPKKMNVCTSCLKAGMVTRVQNAN